VRVERHGRYTDITLASVANRLVSPPDGGGGALMIFVICQEGYGFRPRDFGTTSLSRSVRTQGPLALENLVDRVSAHQNQRESSGMEIFTSRTVQYRTFLLDIREVLDRVLASSCAGQRPTVEKYGM